MALVKKPVPVAAKKATPAPAAATAPAAPAAAPAPVVPAAAAPAPAPAPVVPAAAAPAAAQLPAVAEPTGSDLAVPSAGGAGLGAAVKAVVEGDGFGDLDGALGFGSFPIVTLKETFSMGEVELGTEFECVMISARAKWIIKEEAQKTDKLCYSYDGTHTLGGKLVEDQLNEWRGQGISKFEKKKYMEVTAQIHGGEYDGTFVLLSIAPASVNRLGGYRVSVAATQGKQLNAVVTKCVRGPKLGKGADAFYPWNFELTATLDAPVVA